MDYIVLADAKERNVTQSNADKFNMISYSILFLVVCSLSHTQGIQSRSKRSFHSVNFRIPDRAGRKCHDYCSMMPNLCKNGGTCIINEKTCMGSCRCVPGWTGKWCRDAVVLDDPDIYSDHTVAAVTNSGQLANSGVASEQSGILSSFGGLVLDLPTRPTLGELGQNGTSKGATTGFLASVNDSTSDQENEKALRDACLNQCSNKNCINVDGVYKCIHRVDVSSIMAPRVCGPGFECMHGVCDMEALETNSYRCICEESYVGQFCTAKCPLECGEHGHCDIHVADSTYKCYCQWNYTGVNCSELIPEDPGN